MGAASRADWPYKPPVKAQALAQAPHSVRQFTSHGIKGDCVRDLCGGVHAGQAGRVPRVKKLTAASRWVEISQQAIFIQGVGAKKQTRHRTTPHVGHGFGATGGYIQGFHPGRTQVVPALNGGPHQVKTKDQLQTQLHNHTPSSNFKPSLLTRV